MGGAADLEDIFGIDSDIEKLLHERLEALNRQLVQDTSHLAKNLVPRMNNTTTNAAGGKTRHQGAQEQRNATVSGSGWWMVWALGGCDQSRVRSAAGHETVNGNA